MLQQEFTLSYGAGFEHALPPPLDLEGGRLVANNQIDHPRFPFGTRVQRHADMRRSRQTGASREGRSAKMYIHDHLAAGDRDKAIASTREEALNHTVHLGEVIDELADRGALSAAARLERDRAQDGGTMRNEGRGRFKTQYMPRSAKTGARRVRRAVNAQATVRVNHYVVAVRSLEYGGRPDTPRAFQSQALQR